MRAKTLVLLFVALGCGMIAAVAVSKAVMDNGSGKPAEAMVEIFVAVKDLPHAEKISAENIKLDKWPKSRLPEGAIFDLAKLENKFTKQNIFAGEPILERKVSDSRESFSTSVPPGYRIFDIACNSGYIKAGDHVDILGTFRPGGRTSPPESRTVMRHVKVHGINGSSTRDAEEDESQPVHKVTVFQLLVKESQLEALTLANSLGELQLNLRPFGEDREEQEDTGEEFLSWIESSNAADPEPEHIVSSILPSITLPTMAEEPEKQSLIIVTPNGATTYEWDDENKFPRAVDPSRDEAKSSPEATGGQYGPPSGNVYSGYGGYSPTYPTSVSSPGPGQEEREESDEESSEE